MNINDLTEFKCPICNTNLNRVYINYFCSNECCIVQTAENKITLCIFIVNYKQSRYKISLMDKNLLFHDPYNNINRKIPHCDFFSLTKKQIFKIIKRELSTRLLQ